MIIVDRIIDGIAVCEADGMPRDISLSNIDGNVHEGDVLRPVGERYAVDSNETNKRCAMLVERFERIKTQNKKR